MPPYKIIAAISVGIIRGQPMLDLYYKEDSKAEVDMNVVMDSDGNLIEVQATGEEHVFTRDQHGDLLDLAEKGIMEIVKVQKGSL